MEIFVSPEGEAVSAICEDNLSEWAEFSRASLPLWTFTPGKIADEPCWSYLIDDRSFVMFTKDLPPDATLPQARFRLSAALISQIESAVQGVASLDALAGKDCIEWTLKVDAEGKVTSFRTKSELGKALQKTYLSKDNLTFKPATLNGQAIESTIILKFRPRTTDKEEIEARKAWHTKRKELPDITPKPELDKPFSGSDYTVAKLSLGSIIYGVPHSIRISGNVPQNEAIELMSKLRHWRFHDPMSSSYMDYCTCFGLSVGETEIVEDCSLTARTMIVPKPIKMEPPTYPVILRNELICGVVTMEFTLTEEGTVQDPKAIVFTHEAFAESCIKAVKKWKFVPGKLDGKPRKVKVRVNIPFSVSKK